MTTFSKILCWALLLGSQMAFANTEPPTGKSIFDIFTEQGEFLDIEIETNFDSLFANMKEDYQKAKLTYKTADKETVNWNIEIRQRGKFRRRVCDIPPLKVKFKKKHLLAKGLQPFNDLKLVTHCLEDDPSAKDNLMREYLAYKLYNKLTDNSYRVQLVRITYINSGDGFSKMKKYGFFIESMEEIAQRLDGEECECLNMDRNLLNADNLTTMHVFQYMIGNADYDLMLLRNLKLITPYNGGAAITVPYDFDFSGLVDAPYAIANPDYGLTNVKQRVYLGDCNNQNELERTLSYFQSKEEELLAYVKDFKLLNRLQRDEVMAYLNSFYTAIQEDAPQRAEMLQACP